MTVAKLVELLTKDGIPRDSEVMIDVGINVYDSINHLEYKDNTVLLAHGEYEV